LLLLISPISSLLLLCKSPIYCVISSFLQKPYCTHCEKGSNQCFCKPKPNTALSLYKTGVSFTQIDVPDATGEEFVLNTTYARRILDPVKCRGHHTLRQLKLKVANKIKIPAEKFVLICNSKIIDGEVFVDQRFTEKEISATTVITFDNNDNKQ